MKVRIQNFQSIADSSIVIDGFTVISGPNNCGKSVVIRALEGLFSNKSGHAFVRHGAEHCTVTLEVDGRTVIWKKGKKVNQYVIDGKVYDKVGSNPPAELLDFRVGPIRTGNHEIWPQIAPQFTGQVFLLDQPGSLIAEAIADVERVGVLNKALKLCETDKRVNTSTLKIRRQDLKDAESSLTQYEGLDTTLGALESLKTSVQSLKDKATRLNELKDINSRFQLQKEVINKIQSIEVIELPDCTPLQKKGQLLTYLQDKRDSISDLKELIQRIGPVLGLDFKDHQVEFDNLKSMTSEARDLMTLRHTYQGAQDSIESLQNDLEVCQKELSELKDSLTEFEVCPLCGDLNESHHHD